LKLFEIINGINNYSAIIFLSAAILTEQNATCLDRSSTYLLPTWGLAMQLIIMRHGQAIGHARTDEARALTEQGRHDAHAVGNWLIENDYSADVVLVSPYLRAQQTAEQVLNQLPKWPKEDVSWITPEDAPMAVIQRLAKRSESSIMLVSHQPLVGELLRLLIGDRDADLIAFSPATLVVLEGDMIAVESMQLVAVCA
jgi:phosphohistidine phosphatase